MTDIALPQEDVAQDTIAGRRSVPLLVYAVVYLAVLYIPILLLPLFSFNDSMYMALPLKGWTTKWYALMWSRPGLGDALVNSFKVAIPVAITSTVLATLAAKSVTRYRMPGKGPLTGFILLPMVIPGVVMGISLLVIANAMGMPLSLFTIGLGHTMIATPFSMLVMMSRLEGLDRNLEECSMDLGENAWMTFWRVTFPLQLPGIMASLLMSFTTSFDEFLLAFFLAGNETTLPIYIFGQLRYPDKLPAVLALGACIFMASFVVICLAEWLRRRGVQTKTSTGI